MLGVFSGAQVFGSGGGLWYNRREVGRLRNSPTWIVLGLVVLLAVGCVSHRLSGAEVIHLAQQALAAHRAWHLILDIEIDTDMIKDSLSVEVWEEQPSQVKLVVLDAQNAQLRQLAFASDGTESLSFSPHRSEVTVGPVDLVKMPSVLASLIEAYSDWILRADAYQARVVAIERQEGLVLYNVTLPLSQGNASYWIDARDWLVRKITYEDDYLGRGAITVRSIERADDWPDSTFDLAIPDGVPITEVSVKEDDPLTLQEAQAAADFSLRVPTYPPVRDFPESVVAYQIGEKIVVLYTGQPAFTLLQGREIEPAPAGEGTEVSVADQGAMLFQDEQGGGRLLLWQEGDIQYSLAGNLASEELIRIAESLE